MVKTEIPLNIVDKIGKQYILYPGMQFSASDRFDTYKYEYTGIINVYEHLLINLDLPIDCKDTWVTSSWFSQRIIKM